MQTAVRWRVAAPSTLAAAAVGGLITPGAADAATPGARRPDLSATAHVRAELVDRWGRPSGSLVDSRCPDRTLMALLASRYHYLRHSGVVEPGSTMTFTYTNATTGEAVHVDATTARGVGAARAGFFRTDTVDLRAFMSRGDVLTVSGHHESPGPSVPQDLIEYALLAGFFAIAPRSTKESWRRA